MKLIKSFFSVLFSAALLLSTTTVNSIAIDKLHFVIGGGAGGGWDGTARGLSLIHISEPTRPY